MTQQPNDLQVFFMRHAKSLENDGQLLIVDSPLSNVGRAQAAAVWGNFDYIICSPMRRCLETLHYSNITYGNLSIDYNLRERVFTDSSRMLLEHGTLWERETDFAQRVANFQASLSSQIQQWTANGRPVKILIIGHSYFFNYWKNRPHFADVENAQIFKIL